MTARFATALLLSAVLLSGGEAIARPPLPFARTKEVKAPPTTASGRTAVPLTREEMEKRFAGKPVVAARRALEEGRWTPDDHWLATTGKRYGRLLIVSDLHVCTGTDPLTHKVNPAEDFKQNQQEIDFRKMLERQWKDSGTDGKTRTLVLNGDTVEFMQTSRGSIRRQLGPSDRYGALNTADNMYAKLTAILDGHAGLLDTFADHVMRGHRIAYVPGNHDRQMLHPAVRKALAAQLTKRVAERLYADAAFSSGAGKHKRRALATLEARKLVGAQVEFHPWFFMAGDVVARHSHDADKFNAFSTPFGDYYHPGAKKSELESALGDYIVKAIFNKVERRKPWTDNTSKSFELAKAIVQASDGNPVKAVHALHYLLTRGGIDRSKAGLAKAALRRENDIRRYVRDFGLLEKFNAIRPEGQKLTEAALVSTLVAYEAKAATPVLANFDRKDGALRRLLTIAKKIPSVITSKSGTAREADMADTLFADLYVKTLAVGHDHAFRLEDRIVIDPSQKKLSTAAVMDSATWTDQLPEIRRDVGFVPDSRRGVIVVDFDSKGSHSKLMNFDPVRGLQLVEVLETEKEALRP
jgi:hypothetical protein